VFRVEATTALEEYVRFAGGADQGNSTTTNVLIGDLTGIDTAGSATSFIKADTTGADVKVYDDADGSGSGAAVLIATLTGVSTVAASDFRVEAVQGFEAVLHSAAGWRSAPRGRRLGGSSLARSAGSRFRCRRLPR
jgi:hypothetical protein